MIAPTIHEKYKSLPLSFDISHHFALRLYFFDMIENAKTDVMLSLKDEPFEIKCLCIQNLVRLKSKNTRIFVCDTADDKQVKNLATQHDMTYSSRAAIDTNRSDVGTYTLFLFGPVFPRPDILCEMLPYMENEGRVVHTPHALLCTTKFINHMLFYNETQLFLAAFKYGDFRHVPILLARKWSPSKWHTIKSFFIQLWALRHSSMPISNKIETAQYLC